MNDELVVSLRKPQRVEEPPVPTRPPPLRGTRRSGFPLGPVIAMLVVATLGVGLYFYVFRGPNTSASSEHGTLSNKPADEQAAKEGADVIAAVGRLIVLPEGEVPTLATVSDPEKLKDQAFFAHAKAGYKVLIYTKARKAFLYDPSQDKLIEVAPITTELH